MPVMLVQCSCLRNTQLMPVHLDRQSVDKAQNGEREGDDR
jgi:hypothetical protein